MTGRHDFLVELELIECGRTGGSAEYIFNNSSPRNRDREYDAASIVIIDYVYSFALCCRRCHRLHRRHRFMSSKRSSFRHKAPRFLD